MVTQNSPGSGSQRNCLLTLQPKATFYNTHTHVRTHAHTRVHTRTHVRTHVRTHTRAHTHTYTHAHTYTYIHTHTHTHTHRVGVYTARAVRIPPERPTTRGPSMNVCCWWGRGARRDCKAHDMCTVHAVPCVCVCVCVLIQIVPVFIDLNRDVLPLSLSEPLLTALGKYLLCYRDCMDATTLMASRIFNHQTVL